MTDVFLSYCPSDHARVAPIAERLTSLGYAVAWEKTPPRTPPADADIERRIEAAPVVLTVWTQHARHSPGVFAQSLRALDAGKLVQLRLDAIVPPRPFHALAVSNMSGDRQEWGPLEDALHRLAQGGEGPAPLSAPKAALAFATPALLGAPKLFTIATALLLLAYAGLVWAAYARLVPPSQLQLALIGLLAVSGAGALLAAARLFFVRRAES